MKNYLFYILIFFWTSCFLIPQNAYATLEADSLELVNLYNLTGGPEWTDSWELDDPISTWGGVTLTVDGTAVWMLQLNNNLTGSIPDLNLSELETLSLIGESLVGELPDFSNMPSLKRLTCKGGLTGTIPDFSNLPNLTFLSLAISDFDGEIPNFSNLPNLTILDLSNNNINGEIPDFTNLPNLTTLSCNGNNLVGLIPDFSNLPNLTTLNCSFNSLSGAIPDFTNLPNLESLKCSSNGLTESIPNFTNLPNLTILYLSNNNLNGEIPDFSDIPLLRDFQCIENDLSGAIPDFSNLPNLLDLICFSNELTGQIPNFFNLPLLRSLMCSANQLEGNIPDFTNLPNLRVFNCATNLLIGQIPDFSNLQNLEEFSSDNNNLTGEIPNFSNLPNLELFSCGTNDLEGAIPNFSDLPNLIDFNCYNNKLIGTIPDFTNLPNLEYFGCSRNELTGSIPNFSNLPNLERFECGLNQLNGAIPDFSNVPNLLWFQASFNNLSGAIPDLSHLNLTAFLVAQDSLDGCYPLWLCDVQNVITEGNPGLPDGGNPDSYLNFCNNPSTQYGLSCDDGNPNTTNTSIQPDCSCSSSNPFTNFVEGKLFMDTTQNCTYDIDEKPLKNWLITAVGATATYYDVTDEFGNYKIYTDLGDYNLNVIQPNAYWNICPTVQDSLMTFINPEDSILIDIPLQVDFLCPIPRVDISTPFLRRCFDNDYTVQYCNDGTAMLDDGYIEITFDEYLIVNSSTLPWSNQDGQTYTFEVGDIDINDCGTFNINVSVDCDNTVLGQTHCVEAHIFPDSICFPPNSQWDGSTIKVEAICEMDSLRFRIENTGQNDMSKPSSYLIIEDDLILRTGVFVLEAGDAVELTEEKTGATYRIEAAQSDFHPTNSAPAVSVEGCVNNSEPFSLGFINIFPEDDADPFISIDCQQNIGAYDPNDKRGYPIGLTTSHNITNDTEAEYHIRFQNTGTDTALTVIIRDTLSEFLDPSTIRMGVSSHSYEWNILGTNVLELVFDNIMLPDSTTNERASHGFFKFKINQRVGNPPGSVINNDAAIYFDFNEPVITNNFFHIIEDDLILDPVDDEQACDHWFYLSDTTIVLNSDFSYYVLDQDYNFSFTENEVTYVDTILTEGTLFLENIYNEDATVDVLHMDMNGCDSLVTYNIQVITSLSEIDQNNAINIYPNPAQNKAFILLDLPESVAAAEIKVYNQVGQVFKSISPKTIYPAGKHIISIDVSDYPKGMYYVNFHSNTFTWVKKLLIN